MRAEFKVGDRVAFADSISSQSIEMSGYRRQDVLTVLEVHGTRLDDGAFGQNCRVSGNAWFYGWALQPVDDAALQVKDVLDKQTAVFKAMCEGFLALIDGQKAVSESLTAFAEAIAGKEESEAQAAVPPPEAKPFSVLGAGKYRTRDGRVAIVTSLRAGRGPFPWYGALDGAEHCWDRNGHWDSADSPHGRDLVEKLS